MLSQVFDSVANKRAVFNDFAITAFAALRPTKNITGSHNGERILKSKVKSGTGGAMLCIGETCIVHCKKNKNGLALLLKFGQFQRARLKILSGPSSPMSVLSYNNNMLLTIA